VSEAVPRAEHTSHWREFSPAEFHVMVADDQSHLLEIVGRVLRKDGYDVSVVGDGEELLRQARQRPPDLIVLDLMMPRLDGLSALRRVRADPRLQHAYVLILSGKSSIEEKLEGFDAGADDYMTKPYSIDELRARVRSGIRLRAVERHLERSQQQVVRQEKMATIGVLAAGIAHEFNNIMSGIAGYAQLAQRSEKFRERLVEVALEQSRRAEKITSSLSTFASTASPRVERAPLGPLLEAGRTLVAKSFAQKEATLVDLCEETLPDLELNRGQFQQVILHLLLNAQQAIGLGGRVELRARREGNVVHLEVDDDGPGIAPGHELRIFDPFFTTKGARAGSEGEGTGLGLTFSQNVVEAHRGSIELVPSRLGGACLRVSLPIPPAGTESPPPARASSTVRARPARRVVMVEDDVTIREVVQELLGDTDLACYSSGPEAVEHCREREVDAVLLDINLQGPWNGWQVLEALGTLPTPPPVILTTGSIEAPEEHSYPRIQLLRKPYRLAELETALRRATELPATAT